MILKSFPGENLKTLAHPLQLLLSVQERVGFQEKRTGVNGIEEKQIAL